MSNGPFGSGNLVPDRVNHLTGVFLEPGLHGARPGRRHAVNQCIIILVHLRPMVLQEKLSLLALGKQQDPAHFAIQTMHGISPLHPPRAFLQIGIDHSEHGANLFGSPARRKNACRLVNRQDAIVFEQDLERRTIPLCFPLLVFLDFHMPARFYQILGLPYYAAWHRHAFRNTDAPVTNHLFQMSPGCLRKSRMENLYQGSLPLHINPHGRLIVLFLLHSDPRTYTQEYRKRNFPSSQSTDDISTTIYADRPESGEPYKHRHKGSTLC